MKKNIFYVLAAFIALVFFGAVITKMYQWKQFVQQGLINIKSELVTLNDSVNSHEAMLKELNAKIMKINHQQALDRLTRDLRVYSVYDSKGLIEPKRLGRNNDGGYVFPAKAAEVADILMGYGIADDPSFEEDFSRQYNKPSFGFDCGVAAVKSDSPLFKFTPQCIASDEFVYKGQQSNKNTASFEQQVKDIGAENKKIFIKMDIEGAEYQALDEILRSPKNITGIVLEIHFLDYPSTLEAIKLLEKLKKDFILTHVHGNNFVNHLCYTSLFALGSIPPVLELSYINKNLVTKAEVAASQTHPLSIDMPNNPNLPDCEFEIR